MDEYRAAGKWYEDGKANVVDPLEADLYKWRISCDDVNCRISSERGVETEKQNE